MKMNRGFWILVVSVVLSCGTLFAEDTKSSQTAQPVTLKGEVLDMACFMGHGAKGKEHQSCAMKCVGDGAPMGLLTPDGKVYLIVENHSKAEAYTQLKKWAGSSVQVMGTVETRGGLSAVIVNSAQESK